MEHTRNALQEHNRNTTPGLKTYKYPVDPPEPTPAQRRSDWLLGYAGVTDMGHTFDKMRRPRGFGPTYQCFLSMSEGRATWQLLLVYGGSGNGKSLCCEATVIALYDRGIRTKRDKWSDIVRYTLKASFNIRPGDHDQRSYQERFTELKTRQYLIIDDVGMGSTGGNWEWGELEDIVDYRLEHRLFTIITTNLDLKEIPPRIVSRFRDASRCRIVFNEAKDQRPAAASLTR